MYAVLLRPRTIDEDVETSRDWPAALTIRDWIGSVSAIFMGLVSLVVGVHNLWAQHSGPTTAVMVVECRTVGVRHRSTECSGRWSDGAEPRSVKIVSSSAPHIGEVLDTRIHDGRAYTRSIALPAEFLGGGALMAGVGGYVVARRRR